MNGNNKNSVQFILFSAIMLIIPMTIFPTRFGIELEFGFFAYSMIEIIFYGVVFYSMRPSGSLLQIFQGVGLAFLYRIVMGSLFGIFISLIYDIGFSISLSLGVSRYLPAVLIHILAAPFILRPFFLSFSGEKTNLQRSYGREPQSSASVLDRQVQSTIRSAETKRASVIETDISSTGSGIGTSVGYETNGFERAVRYLGEHHAVRLAAVVDGEGLTLAILKRGDIDPDHWAPLTLLFQESNLEVINRKENGAELEQLYLYFQNKRIVIIKIKDFSLFVLADSEDDDLLKIRIVQATDIIRKYSSERYDTLLSASTEEQHVSNT